MIVVVLATLVAGWFLLLPSDYTNLGRSAAWQAVFGANIHFWLTTGYFAGPAEEQLLLHTWSLAVEEQFYLIVPFVLLGLFSFPKVRRRSILLVLIAVGIAISLTASIYGVKHHPSAAFYLLPTRAWELLCGAFVALIPVTWILQSRLMREAFSLFGIIGILAPCWMYTKATPFPGLAAIPPCIGTAVFIWSSTNSHHSTVSSLPLVARILSFKPVIFIGLISYSLYLWHWPLIAFSNYWALSPRSNMYSLAIVGMSLLLAVLSWRYVEIPFSKRIFCASRKSMFIFVSIGITAVFTLGVFLLSGDGFPSRLPAKAIAYANAKEDKAGIHELTAIDIQAGRLIPIGNLDSNAPMSLLLWGDSHAMASSPAFDMFLKSKGLAGLQATASASAPLLGAYWQNTFTSRNSVLAFNDAVITYIKQHQIPNVVLVAYWEYYTDERGSIPLDVALVTTVKQLVATGVNPWVMLQVPSPSFDVPKGLAMKSIFNVELSNLLATPSRWNGLQGNGEFILKQIEAAGGHILDPRACFMDSSSQRLLIEKNGVSLFRDVHHLSATGAKLVLAPFLNDSLILKK